MAATEEKTVKISFKDIHKTFQYEHLIAGLSGGVTATFILHPLELIRIRFSVSDGHHSRPLYRSMWHCATSVRQVDGLLGLYRGASANVVAHGAYFGLYFLSYNTIKVLLGDGTANPNLTVPKYLLCGCVSGAITLGATNPLWITRTRLCLEYEPVGDRFRGITHALQVLYGQDGFKGLYKGYVPGLFGTSHSAVQFLVYEKLKHWHREKYGYTQEHKLGTEECIAMSGTSKIIAVGSTYPYLLLRARLQDQHQSYDGVVDVIRRTWRGEGWRGFYKGLGPCLLRMTPQTCIMFYVYETVSHQLLHGGSPRAR